MINLRRFSAEMETLAEVWCTTALSTDQWTPTGKAWATNSQPIEVGSQNNLRGIAKPGNPIADKCLRAAHEKIVSDLAYVLGLPIPPAILWDRGNTHRGERYCVISAWAFPNAIEWPHIRAKLKPAQIEIAKAMAGALKAFDTWIGASDRKDEHVLVHDDGDENGLGLAYIDYAFSLSYEWCGVAGAPAEPRSAFPSGVGSDPTATAEIVQAIDVLEELRISEIINRVPAEYFSALPGARDVILSSLLSRRASLKGWLK